MELDISSWVLMNLTIDNHGDTDTSHRNLFFFVVLWNLWLAQNAKIFCTDCDREGSVIARSRHLINLSLHSRNAAGSDLVRPSRLSRMVMSWSAPIEKDQSLHAVIALINLSLHSRNAAGSDLVRPSRLSRMVMS
ncbi:hypothetical protein V6N12_049791 [Hibiscus sabdariffa]|uniref:Uncharacterized protein n=2 Tax=Hibiscus sabdariffa TaxID=183260 RepID=A0ABR2GB30_9ROSI